MTQQQRRSPRTTARIAGAFYLVTFVAGFSALAVPGGRVLANLIASAAYVGVTLLFYDLFEAVNRRVSLAAALFSLAGCVVGALAPLGIIAFPINSLAFFGVYCLLIGYLIFNSTFLPRFLGVLMAIGGLSWLTFIWPPLAKALNPINFAPGILAEAALTLWLLIAAVDGERWNEQSAASHALRSAPAH